MSNQNNNFNYKNYDKFITPCKMSPNRSGIIFSIQLNKINDLVENSPLNPFNFENNNITPFNSTPKRNNLLNFATKDNEYYSTNEEKTINFENITPIKKSNEYHNNWNLSKNLQASPFNNKEIFELLFSKTEKKNTNNFNDSFNSLSKNLNINNLFGEDKNIDLTNLKDVLNFEKKKETSPKPCNCKKSKCLKLYCDCFIRGVFCTKECQCSDCFNNHENVDIVNKIKNEMNLNNPKSFENKTKLINNFKIHSRGCNCKKSGCKKKYCECFINNIACTNLCNCLNCLNVKNPSNEIINKIKIEQKPNKRNKFHLNNIINDNINGNSNTKNNI